MPVKSLIGKGSLMMPPLGSITVSCQAGAVAWKDL